MKFAICNETFKDWPFPKAFEFARECGYTGIEIAPFTIEHNVNDISTTKRTQLVQQASDAGLEVIGLHWLLAFTEGYYLTSPDSSVQQKTSDYLKLLAQFCADVGGHVMVLGSPQQRNLLPNVTKPQAMQIAADVISAAMPTLEELNITLALEPLGPADGDFLLTAVEGIELMKMIDSPHCRLHLDCKAMSSEDISIPQLITDNAQSMTHFHANDPNKQGPGFGELDFVPILQTLKDVNYDGWVSVEVFDYEPGVERLAKDSLDYMKQCLEKVS